MADGTSKRIEYMQIGDEVRSCYVETKETMPALVRELEYARREGYYLLNDGLLNVTGEHPIYVKKKDGAEQWAVCDRKSVARAEKMNDPLKRTILETGDMVYTAAGTWINITSIEYVPGVVDVYNLRAVAKPNTFFANGVLVHNGVTFKI